MYVHIHTYIYIYIYTYIFAFYIYIYVGPPSVPGFVLKLFRICSAGLNRPRLSLLPVVLDALAQTSNLTLVHTRDLEPKGHKNIRVRI